MPSKKILEEKQKVVEELAEQFKKSCASVLVDYKGVNVVDDTALRKELRDAGISYSVRKNSLLKRAAEKAGFTGLDEVLTGPTAVAFSEKELIAPAKIFAKFGETHPTFHMKTGFIEGKQATGAQLEELAKLPSKEALVAAALRGLNAPVTGLVRVLNADLRGLVVALNAIADKQKKAA